jgi:hypothetical protein
MGGIMQKVKKEQSKPKIIKAMTFQEVMEEAKRKHEEKRKLYQESNGLCVNCKKNSGNDQSFVCDECQAKIDKIVKELRGPGFFELSIPIKRQPDEQKRFSQ